MQQQQQQLLDDSTVFFNQQLKEEKALSQKLKLKDDIQERLQTRHSVTAISRFLTSNARIIKHQHFLYELDGISTSQSVATTIRFNWLPNVEKDIHSLESFNYCLFTREEYTIATTNGGLSKGTLSLSLSLLLTFLIGAFYDIRRKQKKVSPPSLKKKPVIVKDCMYCE